MIKRAGLDVQRRNVSSGQQTTRSNSYRGAPTGLPRIDPIYYIRIQFRIPLASFYPCKRFPPGFSFHNRWGFVSRKHKKCMFRLPCRYLYFFALVQYQNNIEFCGNIFIWWVYIKANLIAFVLLFLAPTKLPGSRCPRSPHPILRRARLVHLLKLRVALLNP